MLLIKGGIVYSPEYLGKKDILIAGGKIEAIAEEITIEGRGLDVKIVDAEDYYVAPGFIDSHVHLLGGGGEGGYSTRTPEIQLSQLTSSGITTVVGCLGTDGVTRSMAALMAKARGLEEEGISTFCYTGSYEVPVKGLLSSVKEDIIIIDKIIGVGEIAVADHRSSQPTIDELKRTIADARVGGILSGKGGIVNIHVGDGEGRLKALMEIVATTEIPITQLLPTHINRSIDLFKAGIDFARQGGYVDLTTSYDPHNLKKDEVKASKGLRLLLEAGINIGQISFSSDGQGSLPMFNEKKELVGIGIGSTKTLFTEVRDAIIDDDIAFGDAIRVITENPARILKLKDKGRLAAGMDGDLVLISPDRLEIDTVIAKGRIMLEGGSLLVRGTFE